MTTNLKYYVSAELFAYPEGRNYFEFDSLEKAFERYLKEVASVYSEFIGYAGLLNGFESDSSDNYPIDPESPGEPEFKCSTVFYEKGTPKELFALVNYGAIKRD